MESCYYNSLVVEPERSHVTNAKAAVKHKPETVQSDSHPYSSSHRSILLLLPVCTPVQKKK
jgi:hypothetical protein